MENEKVNINNIDFNEFMKIFNQGVSMYVYRKNVYIGLINSDTIIQSGHIYNVEKHVETIILSMAYALIIFDEFEIIK